MQEIADIAGPTRGGSPPVVPFVGDTKAYSWITLFETARELAEFRRNLAVLRAGGDVNPVAALSKSPDDSLEIPQIHEIAEDEPKALLTQFDRPWLAVLELRPPARHPPPGPPERPVLIKQWHDCNRPYSAR